MPPSPWEFNSDALYVLPQVSAANFHYCRLHRANFTFVAALLPRPLSIPHACSPDRARIISANVDAAQILAYHPDTSERASPAVPLPQTTVPPGRGRPTVRIGAVRNPSAKARVARSPMTVQLQMEKEVPRRAQYRRFQERRGLATPLSFIPPATPAPPSISSPRGLGVYPLTEDELIQARRDRRARAEADRAQAEADGSIPASSNQAVLNQHLGDFMPSVDTTPWKDENDDELLTQMHFSYESFIYGDPSFV